MCCIMVITMEDLESLIKIMKEDSGVPENERIERAFKKVDRADFTPPEFREDAYLDKPLYIGEGQTISQPSTVAFMLELLAPKEGEKILDVGAGSGWTTALLAEVVGEGGEVIGVEKVSSLVEFGVGNLEKYGYPNASIKKAGAELGDSANAPYDEILVSASASEVSRELLEQLKTGGVLVMPVKEEIRKITKKEEGEIDEERYPGFVFVPLV